MNRGTGNGEWGMVGSANTFGEEKNQEKLCIVPVIFHIPNNKETSMQTYACINDVGVG